MSEATLELAIMRTLAYADMFDYPLRPAEVHRYLVAEAASLQRVDQALRDSRLLRELTSQVDDYYALRGRTSLVRLRQERQQVSGGLWPRAARYGRLMAGLPFVRMVAVTGALAVNNVDRRVDLDYLVVTEPGRLWLCRALVILLVRWALLRGGVICPNYFISTSALSIAERSLYTAHELAQMVPISGMGVYWRMRLANPWADAYLPNAAGLPAIAREVTRQERPESGITKGAEAVLRSPAGERLERWEMERKIRKFTRFSPQRSEADFGVDWCKGHFDGHGKRAMALYQQRLRRLGIEEGAHVELWPGRKGVGVAL